MEPVARRNAARSLPLRAGVASSDHKIQNWLFYDSMKTGVKDISSNVVFVDKPAYAKSPPRLTIVEFDLLDHKGSTSPRDSNPAT